MESARMNTTLVILRALSGLFTSCTYEVTNLGNDLHTWVHKLFPSLCTVLKFAVVGADVSHPEQLKLKASEPSH